MKTFTAPVSDCGHFIAGYIDEKSIASYMGGGDIPKYGIVVFYKTKETAKNAVNAVCDAHWQEGAAQIPNGTRRSE